MSRRGEALREHILDTAKLAFLEGGFERTSMDAIAARAETSKRSLYAHFPTKDTLFLAVVERSRTLFSERMATPGEYAGEPLEAIVRYCGRYVQLLHWASIGKTARLGIAEAERLPDLAAGLHDVLFGGPANSLASYLVSARGIAADEAERVANEVLGLTLHPVLPRLLFGVDALTEEIPDESNMDTDVDLDRIRRIVRVILPESG